MGVTEPLPPKPRRIVFADIDGVFNNRYTKERYRRDPEHEQVGFDPRNVAVFNQFLDAARVDAVITSTWRYTHTLEQLRAVLLNAGVNVRVIDMLPPYALASRGLEIQAWLDSHTSPPVETFVIIDDVADMDHLLPRLARTDMQTGMREKHVSLALKILNQPLPVLPNALVLQP